MNQLKRPRKLNETNDNTLLFIPFIVLFIFMAFIAAIDAYIGSTCFGVFVSGDSMYETVADGDFVYAQEKQAMRGDVIIIDVKNYREHDHLSGDYIIKRLIATEGDSVYCLNGVVHLRRAGETQFVPLTEPYARDLTTDFTEVLVGEGEIFFLGDNRLVSYDSRRLGCYKSTDIVGVVPQWSIACKGLTTGWENFRSAVSGWFR